MTTRPLMAFCSSWSERRTVESSLLKRCISWQTTVFIDSE